MVEIRITNMGSKDLARNLRVLAAGMSKLGRFTKEANSILNQRVSETMDKQGTNVETGPLWEPLATSTMIARARGYGHYSQAANNPRTLRWTGRLQRDRTNEVSQTRTKLAMNAPYAVYHQRGGRNLPQRKIIDINETTRRLLVQALQEEVNRQIGIFGRQR